MSGKLLAEWFWTDRWMGSSAFLLPLEPRGLYREMLTQAWRRGAKLPNDPEAIQRAVGASPAEWDRCWPRIKRFWRVDGEDLVNDTQQQIYRKCSGISEIRSEVGKRGAAKREANRQAKPEPKQIATEKQGGDAKLNPPDPYPDLYPSLDPELDQTPTNGHRNTDLSGKPDGAPPPARDPRPILTAKVAEVFAYWIHVMGKNPATTVLTPKRDKNIRARVAQGYTVADLKFAIDGCRLSAFHMGENERGDVFNDLELICRDGQKVEKFRDLAMAGGPLPAPVGARAKHHHASIVSGALAGMLPEKGDDAERHLGGNVDSTRKLLPAAGGNPGGR